MKKVALILLPLAIIGGLVWKNWAKIKDYFKKK